jgi:hypothetical protein
MTEAGKKVRQKEAILKSPICDECDNLWQEYASATIEHLTLDSKLRLAALSHNHEVIRALTYEVESAEEERQWAREAIRKHEATHPMTNGAAGYESRPLSDISN